MKRKAELQQTLEDRAFQLETQLDQIQSILRAVSPNVPKAYKDKPEEYNRLLLINERRGISAGEVREACDNRAFDRIVLCQVTYDFAKQGDELSLLVNRCLTTEFHAKFGDSDEYRYLTNNRIVEKMITRTLTQKKYTEAMSKMSRYLMRTAA